MILALLLVGPAVASSNYPTEIESALGMPCAPTCMLCHESNSGGQGTVTQAFGQALVDRGLTGGGDAAGLATALDSLITDGVDSDDDGTPDADALMEGLDPNGGAAFCDLLVPTYGCLGYTPVAPGNGRWALLAGVGVGLAVSRRRARA